MMTLFAALRVTVSGAVDTALKTILLVVTASAAFSAHLTGKVITVRPLAVEPP